uniref:Ribose 5-phosphate isomerase B n=1 Tax=Roseihalotalea indica TaxID=2867963 RepID=A0AA49GP56_9BACT|nr:ribose 5-phosphate isomerase B [Tunicatimonas sp. TK19036]
MPISIALGADHAGFSYKEAIREHLAKQNLSVEDFGTYSEDSMDYPDVAHPLAESVQQKQHELGILVCGTGNGVAITANKHSGVRAALCWNQEIAALVRQHNDANVLCLPARFISQEEAIALVDVFLQTPFEGGRHARRVGKIIC